MKIGVLCNSRMCLPSLYFLAQQGIQLSLILPEQQHEDHFEIEQFAQLSGVAIQRWTKKELNENLHIWVAMNQLDTIWVMTFPYILSKEAIETSKCAILNFHFAPLPKYKGAQPIFWMIKNGETHGGITVHQITEEVDAGPILHFEPYLIKKGETFGSYNQNIAQVNINAIVAVFNKLKESDWKKRLKHQVGKSGLNCKKPEFNEVKIHWESMAAEEIERLCRACNPWNKGAITNYNGKLVKMIELTVMGSKNFEGEAAGTLVFLNETGGFAVSTKDKKYLEVGIISLEEGFFTGLQMSSLGFGLGAKLT